MSSIYKLAEWKLKLKNIWRSLNAPHGLNNTLMECSNIQVRQMLFTLILNEADRTQEKKPNDIISQDVQSTNTQSLQY